MIGMKIYKFIKGSENVGKSMIAGLLCNKNFASGYHLNTEGISIMVFSYLYFFLVFNRNRLIITAIS
jgi:hypothetical protein